MLDRIVNLLEKIYKALTYDVFAPKFMGISNTNTIEIPFQPAIYTNGSPFTLTLHNLSFYNSMPNIIPSINNTLIYNGIIYTIEEGRYEFSQIFTALTTAGLPITFTLNQQTEKIEMTIPAGGTLTSTPLLKNNFGFTQATYTTGTYTSDSIPEIENFKRVVLVCNEILPETATNIGLGNVSNVFNFSIALEKNYSTIILNSSSLFRATLKPTDRIDRLTFKLMTENMEPINFGNHRSEFQLTGTLNRF